MNVLLAICNVALCAIALRLAWLDAVASSKAVRAKHARGAANGGHGGSEGELKP